MIFIGFFLDKTDPKPLYQQLYTYLAESIQNGTLAAGEKLPGKRTAAGQLGVSVNTVDEAYQMLAAEGYVAARPRSGFVVNRLQQLQLPLPQIAPPPARPPQEVKIRHSFATGDIDTSLFPLKMWNRLLREVLASEEDLFSRGDPMGDAVLRAAIAQYLQGYRGVRCQAGQLVVGAGLEVLVGMLARLFPHSAVALESPGYLKTRRILQNEGLSVCPVPVDEQGMQPQGLAQSGAQVAYLTPSHQYPTGVVMPVARRIQLLRWAGENNGLIVEDDYDSEFRFDGRPLPSLQGLDEGGHVVYAGTFSRSLAPGIRAAYLVLPPRLLARWKQAYGDYACTVWRPEQHTLARFMAGGHFARSLNRMRASYKAKRGLLLQALASHLAPGSYTLQNIHTGLYLVLRLHGKNACAIAQAARASGIRLRALDEYLLQGNSHMADALVLGYGGLKQQDIQAAVAQLANIIAAA